MAAAAFVKDPKRNRLKHVKANKLVGLFHNLRLLFRLKKPDYTEPMVGWNEEDKKVGLVKYGVAHYEQPTTKMVACPHRPPVTFLDHQGPASEALEDDTDDQSDSGDLRLT